MATGYRTEKLYIGGMTCTNCQSIIEKNLRKLPGVQSIQVSYAEGTASITYDPAVVSTNDIASALDRLGYRLLEHGTKASGMARAFGLLAMIAALYLLLEQTGLLNLFVPNQLAQSGMSYGMLFVIGLMTSVHCIAMCGGITFRKACKMMRLKAILARSARHFSTILGVWPLIPALALSWVRSARLSPFQTRCKVCSS